MTNAACPAIEGSIDGRNRESAELLNVKQVADLCNLSARTVYRLADAGKMPWPIKLGASVRWRANELHQWIEDGCKPCRIAKGGR